MKLTNGFHSSKSFLVKDTPAPGQLAFLRGENIAQFDYLSKPVGEWMVESEGRKELLGKRGIENEQEFYYQKYTLVYRRVNGSVNTRTLLTTIIPPGNFVHESLTIIVNDYSLDELLFLSAILNSFVVDEIIRKSISLNISHHYVHALPVIRISRNSYDFKRVARFSAQLICTTPAFDALAQAAGLAGHQDAVTDPAARAELRAELDAQVAHLYGLTEAELAHVLESFPLVKADAKAATLAAYRDLLPDPDEATLAARIAHGETRHLEFKRGAFHNPKTGRRDGEMLTPVVTAVAAFLNSADGGTLLLGIADKPVAIIGLADDLATGGHASEDAYALALNAAFTRLGTQFVGHWDIHFATVQDQRLCRVVVRPASAPAWLDGHLYTRGPAGKQKLSAQAALEYVKQRFKS